MNVINFARETVRFEGIKTGFRHNVMNKMTDENKKIAALVALVFCVLAACTFVCKKLLSDSSEGKNVVSKVKPVNASTKNKDSDAKKTQSTSSNKTAKVTDPAQMTETEIESALAKKTGIRIISAEDYTNKQKALNAIASLKPTEYLKDQYAGHQYYKTFLAVKEGSNEIVGYLSASKLPAGRFGVYNVHVDSAVADINDVKTRLFLKTMNVAKEVFGRQTFEVIADENDSENPTVEFFLNLQKYNDEFHESSDQSGMGTCDKRYEFLMHNYQYKKALETLFTQ